MGLIMDNIVQYYPWFDHYCNSIILHWVQNANSGYGLHFVPNVIIIILKLLS